jgi:hypothetical protein
MRGRKKPETPLETARRHYYAWLEAELELTSHQSYTIGSRTLTKANLKDVREQIQFWQNEIAKLENQAERKGRNRIVRAVPRDL